MAKKATTKSKKKGKDAKFSLKPLHNQINRTITELRKAKQTGSKKGLLQRILQAQRSLQCPQGMLFDLSQQTLAKAARWKE